MLKTKPVSLAVGVTCGLYCAIFTLFAVFTGYAVGLLTLLEGFGYSVTPIGALVGAAYGFIDGAIVGAVFVWLYNRFDS